MLSIRILPQSNIPSTDHDETIYDVGDSINKGIQAARAIHPALTFKENWRKKCDPLQWRPTVQGEDWKSGGSGRTVQGWSDSLTCRLNSSIGALFEGNPIVRQLIYLILFFTASPFGRTL